MGYGVAKEELYKAVERTVAPLRDAYHGWLSRPGDLDEVLAAGAEQARGRARETMLRVRGALGVGPYR
jgi:tryptophanyl-tRNA synthetase